ncbi:MAG TPA: hypothetical protein VD770_03340 [Coxiellaceae bacterium]|nr:hypothetical protein [Coxiellaceae bacterium]
MSKGFWFGFLLFSLLGVSQDLWAGKLLYTYQAPLSVDGAAFVLQSAQASQAEVVVIYNKSSKPLLLNRILVNNPGVSAGWSSDLDPDRWSALSWQGSFTLSCQQSVDQQWQSIPCAQVLQLYKPAASKKMAQGSYWLVENKTKPQLMARLAKALM